MFGCVRDAVIGQRRELPNKKLGHLLFFPLSSVYTGRGFVNLRYLQLKDAACRKGVHLFSRLVLSCLSVRMLWIQVLRYQGYSTAMNFCTYAYFPLYLYLFYVRSPIVSLKGIESSSSIMGAEQPRDSFSRSTKYNGVGVLLVIRRIYLVIFNIDIYLFCFHFLLLFLLSNFIPFILCSSFPSGMQDINV